MLGINLAFFHFPYLLHRPTCPEGCNLKFKLWEIFFFLVRDAYPFKKKLTLRKFHRVKNAWECELLRKPPTLHHLFHLKHSGKNRRPLHWASHSLSLHAPLSSMKHSPRVYYLCIVLYFCVMYCGNSVRGNRRGVLLEFEACKKVLKKMCLLCVFFLASVPCSFTEWNASERLTREVREKHIFTDVF